MQYVLIENLFDLVDVNIFFLKAWPKIEKFNLGQTRTELEFGTGGA